MSVAVYVIRTCVVCTLEIHMDGVYGVYDRSRLKRLCVVRINRSDFFDSVGHVCSGQRFATFTVCRR